MGTAGLSPRWIHVLGIATTILLAGQLALGGGAADATEVEQESLADEDSTTLPPALFHVSDFEFGLGALALLRRERREFRRVPRMLPLVAARTQNGQLWLGLARNRDASAQDGKFKLQLSWTIEFGQ